MGHDALETILVFLVSGVVGVAVAKCLRISPILGFFVVGAFVGPHGLQLLEETDTFKILAELGVAFLLFDVGTHLSFKRLWEARRDLFVLGAGQVVTTTALLSGIGLLFGMDVVPALVIGAGLSLSSTALVLQALKDRDEQGSPLERRAVSVLVFQDLFIVLLLALLPVLAGGTNGVVEVGQGEAGAERAGVWVPLGMTFIKVAVAVAGVIVFGRFLLHPVFRWITATKNDELFVLSALAFVLAVSYGVHALGLPLPLGAFLAGLAISESRYSFLVRAEVAPFRALLLSLFFLSVGMSLPIEIFAEHSLLVAGLTLLLVASKTVTLWVVGKFAGFCPGFALRFGLTLAQGSEFTFVLLAATVGLVDDEVRGVVAAVVSASLALTPLLVKLGAVIANSRELRGEADETKERDNRGKVVIVGFPDAARDLARILVAAGIEYVAFTSDRDRVAKARCQGFAAELGSPDRPRAIGLASVGAAACIVSFMPDADGTRNLVAAVQRVSPNVPIYAATTDAALRTELESMPLHGVHDVDADTPFAIGRQILTCVGRPDEEIHTLLEELRSGLEGEELVPSV